MLFRQNLGGRHQGRLKPVPGGAGHGGGSDDGLSAAHIALQKPVHGDTSPKIREDLLNGAALGLCRGKGQQGEEGCGIGIRHGRPVEASAPVPQQEKAAGKEKKLFKDETPPCRFQRLKGRGTVDVVIGGFWINKVMTGNAGQWQRLL